MTRLVRHLNAPFCIAALLAWVEVAHPSKADDVDLATVDVGDTARGVLGVLGFSIVPNETASSVSIRAGNADDANFFATQLGGAFTVSEEVPVYLEGYLGFARYDPQFVFTLGQEQREIGARWNNFAGTIGVGWDFPLADEWVIRPIANFSLGHVESDGSLILGVIDEDLRRDLDFLHDGSMSAYGLGGSLMLDFERVREDYEADVELRYTHIRLQSFNSSSAVKGSADAQTLGLWTRIRVPTGIELLNRPFRAVGEVSASYLIGDQRIAIGSDYLIKIGGGVELDLGESRPLYVRRMRLLGRYLFGDNATGFSVGIGISF